MTRLKKGLVTTTFLKCAQCPTQQSPRVAGIRDGQRWFCSYNCKIAFQEEARLDALTDHDGTDYRGIRTN